uniref:Uncharacterized protein n=1 Tax=Plectus sambesii TaxID=2011161 RepID=A0A914VT17_9BILA
MVATNTVAPVVINGTTEIALSVPELNRQTSRYEISTQTLGTKEKVFKFVKKYLCEGQKFAEKEDSEVSGGVAQKPDWFDTFGVKHRKLLAFLIPPIFMWIWWWAYAIAHNVFAL